AFVPASERHAAFDLLGTYTSSTPRQSATVYDQAFDRAVGQLRRAATSLDPANGYPRLTKPDGNWAQQSATQWTSGFFAGTLWYMYQGTRDSTWRLLAERWQEGLEGNKSR